MTVPKHILVSFRGRFEYTPEEWSHSHRLAFPDGLTTFADGNISHEALINAWAGLATSVLHTGVVLTDVRTYEVGTNGRMVGNPNVTLLTSSTERAGGVGFVVYPPQVALVVTTLGENRGPARFGRFYLPTPGFPIANDRRISISNRDNAVAAARTFLLALRDSWDVPLLPDTADANPINVSERSADGKGTKQDIKEVRVGRVLDTQRRRRASMDEDYGVLAL